MIRAILALATCGWLAWVSPARATPQTTPDKPATKPASENVANPALRRELLERVDRDQQVRQRLIQWMQEHKSDQPSQSGEEDPRVKETRQVDAENRTWLKSVLEKSGWPVASQVGTDGAHAAWLLVQHADEAPEFQKQCLELMRTAAPGEVSRTDIAYLTDRVMVRETGKQLYGTQVQLKDGKWEPLPLAEPERIDALRKEAQMQPLAEYLELVTKVYSGSTEINKPATGDHKSP